MTDRSKAVLLLWIFFVFVLSCVCYVFVRVCLYVLCGHLLGKDWPLGSRLWCLLWVCHFPIGILGQVWSLIVSIPDLCTLTYFAVFGLIGMIGSIHASDPWFHSGLASTGVLDAGRGQRPKRSRCSQCPSALLYPLSQQDHVLVSTTESRSYVRFLNRVDNLSKSCDAQDCSSRCWRLNAPGVYNRGLLLAQVSNLMPWIWLLFWRLAKHWLISSLLVVFQGLWSSGIG